MSRRQEQLKQALGLLLAALFLGVIAGIGLGVSSYVVFNIFFE
jgi:hypothetical protein